MTAADLNDGRSLRASPRLKLFQPTEMTAYGTTTRAHILNLSMGGALIYMAEPPAPGTRVRVRCGGEVRTARVAWASGRRCGVVFSMPLSPGEVTGVIAAEKALIAEASARIELSAVRGDTAPDRRGSAGAGRGGRSLTVYEGYVPPLKRRC